MEAGELRYHGKPCGRCAGTLRMLPSGNCYACHLVRQREQFHNLSGVAYNRRLLQMRRVKALRRMRERGGDVGSL